MGFSDSVNKSITKVLTQVDAKCYRIAYRLFTEIIQTTPSPAYPGYFAEGHLANQWYPALGNTYSSSVSSATNYSGNDSIIRVATLLKTGGTFLGKDGTMTMTNNVPYANQAESLGWAKTAPYRMVFTALQKVSAENRVI